MLPVLVPLFGAMSVSTGRLQKVIADRHFSQLEGEGMGEQAQPGTTQ